MEEENEVEIGLILAQKVIRREEKPTPEACTKLLLLRAQMDDEDLTQSEEDMKNILDQAINTCKSSLYKSESTPFKKKQPPWMKRI